MSFIGKTDLEQPNEGTQDSRPTQKVRIGETVVDFPDDLSDPMDSTDPSDEGESGKDAKGQSRYPEGFTQKYANKSREELLDILHNSEKELGKRGALLEQAKSDLTGGTEKRTSKVVDLESKKIEDTLQELKQKLEKDLDPIMSSDEYGKTEKQIQKLEKDLATLTEEKRKLEMKEMVDQKYDEDHNNAFLENARRVVKDETGLDFTDEQWNIIIDKTKEINGIGKLTTDSLEAAVMLAVGRDTYRKILKSEGEIDMRTKMSKAVSNVIPNIGRSATAEPIEYKELNDQQKLKVINSLPTEAFIRLCKEEGINPQTL
jgi:hypothetical protein